MSREPFKVLDENTISPARTRNRPKTHVKKERVITTESEKIGTIHFKSSQLFEQANVKTLAMSFAFAQALLVVQNRHIESLRKRLAFNKIINYAKSNERSEQKNSRSAEKIIITPKKRRLLNEDVDDGVNIPDQSDRNAMHDSSPLNMEKLKISENCINTVESSTSLAHKHGARRIDYEVANIISDISD